MGKDNTMKDHEKPVIEPLMLTIQEVADALSLSRAKVYRMLDDRCLGGIPVTRFQRSVRVSVADLRRWIEQRQNETKNER
jgi:excisionase family DNA binding protein